jgi:hypothetical protein
MKVSTKPEQDHKADNLSIAQYVGTMGYELHITRAKFWAENEGHEISRAEWLRLIEKNAELTIDEHNGPLFIQWGPTSPHHSPWFDWAEGNIYTKNPDRKTLAKMLQIADLLGATVQGDDGEIYATANDYPKSLDIGKTEIDSHAGRESGLSLLLKRGLFRNRLEYIIVGLVVLVWVLYDLASG